MRGRALLGAFAAVAVVVVVGGYQVGAIGASEVAPVVVCDSSDATYGGAVTCSAEGDGAHMLRWPDGAETALETAHTPVFVGDASVEVIDEQGVVLAATPIRIEPDMSLECEAGDEVKKVFQLEHTDLRERGWDYVFTNIETGDLVRPGDPGHPNGGAEDGLEKVLLDEAKPTRFCRVVSEAVEALDGEYLLEIESPWEAPQRTPLRMIGPSSKTVWSGTQPAELTATVTVNNITASERVDVYQSGCS